MNIFSRLIDKLKVEKGKNHSLSLAYNSPNNVIEVTPVMKLAASVPIYGTSDKIATRIVE